MTKRERNGEALEGPVAVAAVVPHKQGGGRDEGARRRITKMVSVVRFMGLVARKYTTEAMTCQRMTQALASAWDWFQVSTASPMGRAKRSTVKIQKYNMI